MELALTPDQRMILEALDALAKPYASAPLHEAGFALTSARLDAELTEGGFLDVAHDPDLGLTTAALVVERLARLPHASDAAARAMIGPALGIGSGPLCLVEAQRAQHPIRNLCAGARVVVLGDAVTSFIADADAVRPVPEALFAYPMARLAELPMTRETHTISADALRTRWRIALAAETAGLLAAALDSVCAHVAERKQFGRPIASFQAVRHRLAEAQVRSNGAYWLAMKAAASQTPADAALAALYAQQAARQCTYDFHQFMGAMGMTLEHPLHCWTYRLKALIGELGGRGGSALAAADALWGESKQREICITLRAKSPPRQHQPTQMERSQP